jgi:UDP-N-acetylmuramoyl-L-alanyl-D-glutamate--2,6-diaminopimelate ligase
MPSSSETVAEIARAIGGSVVGDDSAAISDVTHDSRSVGPGSLFVAVRGFTRDGHDFVADVERAGAAAVLVDHRVDVSIPQIVVADTRLSMGPAAAVVHHRPSERLTVIGVTGTNGKTSVTQMVQAILGSIEIVCGVVGTLGIRVGDSSIESERTTPEASDFQRTLATIAERGATVAAVEVSSHALELGRVDGTRFSVAAFTNLSQDHLDFHGNMDRYFDAKAKLFEPSRSAKAVVFVDDEWGAALRRRLEMPCLAVAIDGEGDLTGTVVEADLAGSSLHIRYAGQEADARISAAGRFSVANALVAAGCCLAAGFSFDDVVSGLSAIRPVPGRFELVDYEGGPSVVVDYSHTPAGVQAAIDTARPLTDGRLIAVLGAGGDRDRAKRPLMGAAASAADFVIVTSDNPRSEPPAAIMAEVMAGVTAPNEAIEDRRSAIRRAIEIAAEGDTVLLMGKGHEAYQEIAGVRRPFHDATVAREELIRAGGAGS